MTSSTEPRSAARTTILMRLARAYHAAVEAFEQQSGMSAARWRLLFLIEGAGSCTQRYLVQQIRVDPASITRQLKRLEAEGYIERESDARDNRYTRVRLSSMGLSHMAGLMPARKAFLNRMLEGLVPEDVETLAGMLDRITANMGVQTSLPPMPGDGSEDE